MADKFSHECKGDMTQQHAQGQQYRGYAQRASDYDSYPLCYAHHLSGPNSIEATGIKAFVAKYGNEQTFIDRAQRELLARGYAMKAPK